MSLSTLENIIVIELRSITGNMKITKNWIMEWSTGPVKAAEGETLYYLPTLKVNCAIKAPAKKPKQTK